MSAHTASQLQERWTQTALCPTAAIPECDPSLLTLSCVAVGLRDMVQ